MKIRVEDVRESDRSLEFPEPVEELNELLARAEPAEYRFVRPAEVAVTYYRCGRDLVFDGRLATTVAATCARCLETYAFEVAREFRFVLEPLDVGHREPFFDRELTEEDLCLSHYSGDEIDLSALVREQLLLALPTRPLCREDCPGLCPHCGRRLAVGSCGCSEKSLDPRWAPLRALKLSPR